jgi:phage/plasmid-like protein (TIGR03299 family)
MTTNQDMRQDFIDQTGLTGDQMEYANPSRSQVDTMMYTGLDPWHRLGTRLDNPATAAEAIAAAGLEWEIAMEPLFAEHADGMRSTDHYATVRQDTGEIFGVGFSNRYAPLQNKDAFAFFDGVVGANQAIYHTAGSLKRGRIVWILAKLPGDLGLEGDAVEKYIMLSNTHDGTQAVDMRFCVRRVVCMNTFKLALQDEQTNVRLRHTGNILGRINSTRDLMGLGDAYFANFMRQVERLAVTPLSPIESNRYFESVVGLDIKRPIGAQSTRRQNIVSRISALYNGEGRGSTLATTKGTAWGAFNAVQEYVEHHKPVKNQAKMSDLAVIEARETASFYGVGQQLEQRAWNRALSLVDR